MQVNVFNLMTTTSALIETARDAAFNAITAAAVTRMAAHYQWGGEEGAKLKTLVEVDEEMVEQFFAKNKESNAYRWIKMAKDVSKKLNKDHKDTLKAARESDTVDSALDVVRSQLKLLGADTLDNLELWATGHVAKTASATDYGKTLATLLEKHGESFTESDVDSAVKALGDMKARFVMLRDQQNAKAQDAENLREAFAARA